MMGLLNRALSKFTKIRFPQEGEEGEGVILPSLEQLKRWRKANRKMDWGINESEFKDVSSPPTLTEADKAEGFSGVALCYGFAKQGDMASDPILSAKLAWELAKRERRKKIWQCEYADFNRPENMRLRPEALPRPRGFYYIKINPGERFKGISVAQFRRGLVKPSTGCGPECFQLLGVTNPHLAGLMNARKLSFFALADYDIAPHGFNDFYDAPQLFCSNDILGLGVGSVYGPYPLFGIPVIQIVPA